MLDHPTSPHWSMDARLPGVEPAEPRLIPDRPPAMETAYLPAAPYVCDCVPLDVTVELAPSPQSMASVWPACTVRGMEMVCPGPSASHVVRNALVPASCGGTPIAMSLLWLRECGEPGAGSDRSTRPAGSSASCMRLCPRCSASVPTYARSEVESPSRTTYRNASVWPPSSRPV